MTLHGVAGEPDAGIALGEALRGRGLPVGVGAGETCAGPCAEAFLGGMVRQVDSGGRLGVSSVSSAMAGSPQPRTQAAALWASRRSAYYIRAGVGRDLLRLQAAPDAPALCFLTPDALRRFHVVNEVIDFPSRH